MRGRRCLFDKPDFFCEAQGYHLESMVGVGVTPPLRFRETCYLLFRTTLISSYFVELITTDLSLHANVLNQWLSIQFLVGLRAPVKTLVKERWDKAQWFSTLLLSSHIDKVLQFSGPIVSFLTFGEAHNAANQGLTAPNDPLIHDPLPKLPWHTCQPFVTHQCAMEQYLKTTETTKVTLNTVGRLACLCHI